MPLSAWEAKLSLDVSGKALMSTPADSGYCWQEILTQHKQLSQFKERLPLAVKAWLSSCEWTLIPRAGQAGMPLLVIRCPGRVQLRHPLLVELAESAHINWQPLDLSLFSAEATEPIRVLSQTLMDMNRDR